MATSARPGDLPAPHRPAVPDRLIRVTTALTVAAVAAVAAVIWCDLVAMACELAAWMQMLALAGPPAPGNLTAAAAHVLRRLRLRLSATWPWVGQFTAAISCLRSPVSLAGPDPVLTPVPGAGQDQRAGQP